MYEQKSALRGSGRRVLPGSRESGDVDRTQVISVTVYVRPNPATVALVPALEDYATLPLDARPAAALNTARDARPEDLTAVEDFARHAGLEVVESSAARRSVRLSGTID